MDSLWTDAYRESIKHRCSSDTQDENENYATDEQVCIRNRTRVYIRQPDANEIVVETVPNASFTYKLWRKVYDRSAHIDSNHGLEGRIVTEATKLLLPEKRMAKKINLICRDLFCYHSNYAYIGKPQRTPIGVEMMNTRPILDFFRQSALIPGLRISTVVFSGSFYEDLKAPPTVKKVQVLKDSVQSEAELIEASDLDIMLVMEDILPGSKKVSPGVQIETKVTSPGYLRIRILDTSLVKKFPSVFDVHSQHYYLNRLACDALKSTQVGEILEELHDKREGWSRFSMDAECKGPARKNLIQLLIRESANETDTKRYFPLELDLVGAFPCLEWPSVAKDWLLRNHRSGWPNKELIEHILSAGCHIVGTSHCNSIWPDVEFRFSFSNAEALLSKSLRFEQRQCYASFKGIAKHAIDKLEGEIGKEVKLKSYHLKNVFLWACETISLEEWLQQHTWPKCLLFLIDQLLFCLQQRVMPGYFIPQCNLFDPIPAVLLDSLQTKLLSVRQDPLTATIDFLKTTLLYKDISLGRLLKSTLQPSTEFMLSESQSQIIALNCLQGLIVAFDSNSKNRFGKKAAIYDVFSNWCKSQNNLNLSDCMCRKFSLFDVVYLDITYQADVAEDILKGFAECETSAVVLSKLALCYVEAVFGNVTVEGASRRDMYIRKATLLFKKSIAREQKSDVLEYALFLYKLDRYEEAKQALKPMLSAISKETMESENAFEMLLVKTFVKEAIGRQLDGQNNYGDTYLPPTSFAYFLLVNCYLNINDTEDASKVAMEFEQYCSTLESSHSHLSFYLLGLAYNRLNKDDEVEKYFRVALKSKLLSRRLVFARDGRKSYSSCFHFNVIFSLASWAAEITSTDGGAQNFFDGMRRCLDEIAFSGSHISKTTFFCFSLLMRSPCSHCNQFLASASPHFHTLILPIRWSAMHHIPTPSNKLYYAHLMLLLTTGESILPVLLEVIETEKRHPMSVIIWPKELRNMTDEYVRKEIDEAEERGFIAIPSIVYAYYLLVKLYLRLGNTEVHAQKMREFESLCLDMEDLSPVSYSLLGYAYLQLANHETLKDENNQCIQHHGSETSLNVLQQRSFYIEITEQIYTNFLAIFTDEQRAAVSEILQYFEYGSDMGTCAFCVAAA